MTASTETQAPGGAAQPTPGVLYNARLATRITRDARRRLKLAAAVADTSISALLTELLDRGLPTDAELSDLVKGDISDDQH